MKPRDVDAALKAALQSFYESWSGKRATSFAGSDFEALRERLAKVRDAAIDDQEALLARFEEEARRHGSQVLRAEDGAEANRIILEILERHGAKTVVKSKSMVSEETGLNAALARHGVAARETDLGEWIVQLAGEAPTHMVMPAIHLTRAGVARIFAVRLGRKVVDDIPSLVRIAREELRHEILAAPAGLTGANALIAESGAVMLVTNEGNGRLVSSLPPVHIVLTTTEKVLPNTADALLLLRLLTRNATGQPVTSYVSFIAGPHRAAQYIVLLDNHRSELRTDPRFREVLRCIKCSACLNVCPVYQVVGGGVFSHVYMGGIGSLLTAWIHGLRESADLAGLCLGCHRCEEVCATKIPIGGLVAALRERLVRETGGRLWKRIALDGVLARPALQRGIFRAGRAARPAIQKEGYARGLPLWMKKYDRFRALPAPAKKSLTRLFHEDEAGRRRDAGGAKGPLTLFPGCLVQNIYPGVGLAAGRVLARLGYEVRLGPGGCCGFPAWNAGHTDAALRAFLAVFQVLEGEGPIITLCPTCTTMLARVGPELVRERRDRKPGGRRAAVPEVEELERCAGRVAAFSQFLACHEKGALERLLPGSGTAESIAYHDSCHHKYVLGASGASREILKMASGAEPAELPGAASCCGFAGVFSIDHAEVSEALLADRLAAVSAAGADVVALDCPGCLLQIRGGCARRGLKVEVRHTAEILDERLRDR